MLAYRVDDMTCGHCASSITKAVRAVDAGATVEVDLAQHLVRIEPTEADSHELSKAITEAGYTPVPVEPPVANASTRGAGGCCCGSGAAGCGS
jgi:copper chaperone